MISKGQRKEVTNKETQSKCRPEMFLVKVTRGVPQPRVADFIDNHSALPAERFIANSNRFI